SLVGDGNPKVIFTTAYGEYAIDGFKLDIVDYLLKPFDFDEFMRAVNKARHLIELERGADAATENASVQPSDEQKAGADDFFFVKSEYKLVKIEISKILYVEGLKDYVKIYMSDSAKAVLTLATLKQMETRLMPYSFVRLHRSFIVNVKMITGVERGVVLIGEARIPVGEGYKQNFQILLDKLTL
ncbi:MAG: LytR/AlgR family response regulator transcription factor, partial [Marinilabiliaceae bacterium]